MFEPGKLNQMVMLKRRATGQDAAGQPLTEMVPVAAVWASIVLKSGAESIRSDKDVSIVPASIRIRSRAGVTAAMEVHHGETVYQIKAVLPDLKRSGWMDLVCEIVHG
jgi:SPP1 family predicted phage head-tail adaptor